MAYRQHLCVVLSLCLLGQVFSVPAAKLIRRDVQDNKIEDSDRTVDIDSITTNSNSQSTPKPPPVKLDADDFFGDDDDELMRPAPTSGSGGMNLFSLLRLAGPLLQSNNPLLWNLLSQVFGYNPSLLISRRNDIVSNEIKKEAVEGLKPPPHFQRQESGEGESLEADEDSNGSGEKVKDKENASNSSDDDDDEPPEGDGQGGGILGILAGLSGGEEGQSDLGSLLATISGIVVNLSGDGVDVNALIASGLGLFVGLLSEGEENPGAVIGSYLLTSLDTITGGGANNNGAFFGNLVSKLIKGTSAGGDPDAESDENGGTKMADSAGFFLSLLMSILGDMSKTSSSGSSSSRRHDQMTQIYRNIYK